MERPNSAAHDRDPGLFPPPHGPVLYVPPLRIVAPPGVPPFLPPSFNPQNPFNGFHPNVFRHGVDTDPNVKAGRPKPSAVREYPPGDTDPTVKAGRPKPSAVREYPPGCGRNGGAKDPEPRTPKAQQGQATPRRFEASQPELGKPPEGRAASPSSARRNRKRNCKATSESDANKPRRPAGRPRVPGTGAPSNKFPSPRKAVIDTLRLYDALRRNWVFEEEMKGKEAAKAGRPDLNAGSVINSKGLAVNRGAKVVGQFPGVEVGDFYYFRMEICCIGLHGPIQAGIEYLTAKESEWNKPVAISIISAGGYDARDDGEVLIYTGQGGKSADSKHNEDQKLERGNLAMEGSMKHETPVRVIRGIKDALSPSGKTYTYDGLYKVEQSWSEKGKFGFEEFKFKLRRMSGQPELGSAVIKLSNHLKYKPATRKGVRIEDLSLGKESLPVCVVNSVDDQRCPAPFEYSTSLLYPTGTSHQSGLAEGCLCEGACKASQTCSCFSKNGNSFAYLNNGLLVKERGVIHECGSNCKCSLTCRNRWTQRPMKYRLEVYKTEDKGWGLRSWDIIPAGSFVCEYAGRLVHNLHSLQTKDYVLNFSRLTKNSEPWGDVSKIVDSQASQAANHISRPELMIDSSDIGNMARFINHSCSPNLLVQCVLREPQDRRYPHVMLFAMDNIPPFRELTIDYGSEMPTSEPQVQSKLCLCRSAGCRGRF